MTVASAADSGSGKQVVFDNTYIENSAGHGQSKVFKDFKVKQAISTLLQERLKGQQYDPVTGTKTAKALATELRDHIKALGYDRHKLIVQVTFSQQIGQAMRIASRCLWDPANDSSAWGHYENDTFICVCQVYGLYYE